eukprot:Colp12_sorted_trinity150504_noHs@33500
MGVLSHNALYYTCFVEVDGLTCGRMSTIASLCLITAVMCIYKLYLIHTGERRSHQYFIFYLALTEVTVYFLNVLLFRNANLDFLYQYLRITQLLVICYFYCTVVLRIVKKKYLVQKLLRPVVGCILLYFLAVYISSVVQAKDDSVDCHEKHWVIFSASQLALSFVSAGFGWLITVKLRGSTMSAGYRQRKIAEVWALICVYAIAAIISFVYDMVVLLNSKDDCNNWFGDNNRIDSTLTIIVLKVFSTFVPIWAMLLVFRAAPTKSLQGVQSSTFTY